MPLSALVGPGEWARGCERVGRIMLDSQCMHLFFSAQTGFLRSHPSSPNAQGLFKSTVDCPQCSFNSVKFDPL